MDSLQWLAERKGLATADDQLAGFIYTTALELAAQELGPETAQTLRLEAQVPKRLIGLLKYPVSGYLDLVWRLSRELTRRGWALQQVLHRVGMMGVEGFLGSPVGKTVLVLSGDNPHRLLRAAPLAYRTVYTFGERSYEARGENAASVHYRSDFLGPLIQAGVLEAGVRIAAGISPTLTPRDVTENGLAFTLDVRWPTPSVGP